MPPLTSANLERAWTADPRANPRGRRGISADSRASADSFMTYEENGRLRRDLSERDARITSLEGTFITYLAQKERAKTRDAWLRGYALDGRLLLHSAAVALHCFEAWANEVANGHYMAGEAAMRAERKTVLALVRARAVHYSYRKQDITLVYVCFAMWMALVGKAKSETKVAAALQRLKGSKKDVTKTLWGMFEGKDQELVCECFSFWEANRKEMRLQRNIAENEEALLALKEKTCVEKKRLMDRFGANAMGSVQKMITAGNTACIQYILAEWIRVHTEGKMAAEQQRLFDEAKELADAGSDRAQQQKLAALNRSFGVAGKALLASTWGGWRDVIRTRKQKGCGMAAAMRGCAAQDNMLQVKCFIAWAADVKYERLARHLAGAQSSQERIAENRKRVLAHFEKSLAGASQALLQTCFSQMRDDVALNKQLRKDREKSLGKTMRMIAGGAQMIKQMAFEAWTKTVRETKESANDKNRRRKCINIGREIVVRLRCRIILRCAWDTWLIRTM